jgi:peptide/nickel transport system permease protein
MTLLVVIVVNFFLFRILPGDPIRSLIHSPRMTREAQESIKADFGLDKPIWLNTEKLAEGDFMGVFDSQFFAYIENLVKGNFGISFHSKMDVGELLAQRVWRTVILIAGGEILCIIFGISLGVIAAWKRGTRLDTSILLGALFAWALPGFFFGIILLLIFSGRLPIGGMVTPGLRPIDGWEYWLDVGKHLILPTITMAVVDISPYILIMRSSLVEVLSEDYILSAKAKGLTTFQILRDHAIKNAMLPMITIIALRLGFTVGGAIQTETVFSWPGVGRLMFDAVAKQDYPVLQGVFLLLAVSVIVANFAADILYSVLDPRVKAE